MSISMSSATASSLHLPTFLSSRSLLFTKPHHLSLTHNINTNNAYLLSKFSIKCSSSSDNTAEIVVKDKDQEKEQEQEKKVSETNGSVPKTASAEEEEQQVKGVKMFEDPKWVNGTWDLKQFQKNGVTDWDAVIDAEARRRKWLQDNPESSTNENPVLFDTSIIPWWAWMKRFHLPEAELLNGRAAMIGFFMAYFVDSLTGLGLVDQMSNFFCKTLLFIAVGGVLLIRKNEDLENLKKLVEESTFYDKQWQATWQDDNSGDSKKY